MEDQISKCSHHKDIDAIKCCGECHTYLCNKCEKLHSELFDNHHTFQLDNDIDELFTGFCQEKNHPNELNYHCKDHNKLCCSSCISKIKTRENGKHHDCNVCDINDICDEKKKNLSNNIKNLENLSNIFQSLINELKQIIEEIDHNKEKVKGDIQKIFSKIHSELDKREEQLLKEVDKIFENKFNIENLNDILKDKKYSDKIKKYIEKGKIDEKEWNNNKNKTFLINDCINIEKSIDKLNNINSNLEKYKLQDKKLNFYCQSDEVINLIKKLGTFDGKKINQQEICVTINNFDPEKLNYRKKISSNFGYFQIECCDGICFFISKNEEYVLGYVDSSHKTIIFYDINNNNEIKKLNNAHNSTIYTIKHYPYDKYDIILSTSENNDIKIWNFKECLNILTISKIFESNNSVFSACIIFNQNNFNIFCTGYEGNYIKLFNSKGVFIKNLGNKITRFYIDSSEIEEKKYLLVGGQKGIEVYNYPELTEYYNFKEENDTSRHNYGKIIKINNTYNLIDTGYFNSIKIWDFLNKSLIIKIISNNSSVLSGFAIINNRYLLIGSQDNNIKEFDIEKQIMIKDINKHSETVIGIKPVKDKNGNIFFVSYGYDKNIYLWG